MDLTKPTYTHGLIFTAQVYDNGPDEITISWYFGNKTNITTFYENKDKTYPVNIIENQSYIFTKSGKWTITIIASDNHGGKTVVKFDINIP